MTPMIAEIRLFAGTFAPRGWSLCQGQLLAVSSHDALFSLLGTTYGGDGRTTFGLPDLRGRAAMHPGSGPGQPTYRLGQQVGQENVTMTIQNLPSHSHTPTNSIDLHLADGTGTTGIGANNSLASTGGVNAYIDAATNPNVKLEAATISLANTAPAVGLTGGSRSIYNYMPSLGLNYIIAMVGTYPSRT